MDDPVEVARVVELLRRSPDVYPVATPHPRASGLTLPNGAPAPASVRAWAAFDDRWPDPFSSSRGTIAIATGEGVLLTQPMDAIFRYACLESIAAEIEGDDATRDYLETLSRDLAAEHTGHGVLLNPNTQPDCILLLTEREATILWYERDEVNRREAFSSWVKDVFE